LKLLNDQGALILEGLEPILQLVSEYYQGTTRFKEGTQSIE